MGVNEVNSIRLFAIRRKSDGRLLQLDKSGVEKWIKIEMWDTDDLVVDPSCEVVEIVAND